METEGEEQRAEPAPPRRQRPGYLTAYAEHAGISKQAATKRLERLGIKYLQPFDFAEADRLYAESRERFLGTDGDPDEDEEPVDPETAKDATYIQSRARREKARADITELQLRKMKGELIEVDAVRAEWFRMSRQVRDRVMSISSRIGDNLAAEMDGRKVREMLDVEHRQALEDLAQGEGHPADSAV